MGVPWSSTMNLWESHGTHESPTGPTRETHVGTLQARGGPMGQHGKFLEIPLEAHANTLTTLEADGSRIGVAWGSHGRPTGVPWETGGRLI